MLLLQDPAGLELERMGICHEILPLLPRIGKVFENMPELLLPLGAVVRRGRTGLRLRSRGDPSFRYGFGCGFLLAESPGLANAFLGFVGYPRACLVMKNALQSIEESHRALSSI